MKAQIPQPVHESYRNHRRQLVWQILLPVVLAALLIVGLTVLVNIATFTANGDVERWAAIATIWIVVPIMIVSLILIALLTGLVYLMKQLLRITPTYTGRAQDFVHKIAMHIKRIADAIVKPVLFIDGIGASVKRLAGRK
jgi:hypothetical protein